MKNKVGTLLDGITVRKLKEQAAREGRSMSDIIDEALTDYFEGNRRKTNLRLAAVEQLCSRPFNLSGKQVQALLNEDAYDA